MTQANPITQTFVPGPRLIDGSDLNNLVSQTNSALLLSGGFSLITALATVGAGTLTAAAILGGDIARGGAQLAAAFTDTTDTAANIISAMGSASPIGASTVFIYQNNTNADATLAGGTSVTLSGNAVVPKLTTASYLVTKTSATAVTMQFLQGGPVIPLPVAKYTSDSVHTGGITTLQVAGLVGAQIATIKFSDTTPGTVNVGPAADIVAAIPNVRPGLSTIVNFRNPTGNGTAQLSGLTGVTFTGATTMNAGTIAQMQMDFDSLTSVHFTSIAQSTAVSGS